MIAHELLLQNIEKAINIASDLSEHEHDQYARAVEALIVARQYVAEISIDRSAECQCGCHTGDLMHCMPCSCYSGKPRLND